MLWNEILLTAEWRHLAMLNYEVEPALLAKLIPAGTELDCWSGKAFVSLVGFRFLKTRVCGISVPFHRNFDEVNLRFYVRRRAENEIRRGVVFIKEIVPRWAIAAAARRLYNEKYVALPMHHEVASSESGLLVEYGAKFESDVIELYGRELASVLAAPPLSAFLAEGSDITVFRGQNI